ncbi:MAG: hypothetical protein KF874_00455 [Rhizobiaceae bacterium]|nr:hypothetical protein [Rhizobiaceae bacterium]
MKNLLGTVWNLAIRPQFGRYLITAILGASLRVLTVLCFVATIQALLVAAKPDSGYLHILTKAANLPPLSHEKESMIMAGLVVVLFVTQFVIQNIYQALLGKGVSVCAENIYSRQERKPQNYVFSRRAGVAMYEAAVKSSEICLFLSALYLILALFDHRIFLAMVLLGAIALLILIYGFRNRPWRIRARETAKAALLKSPPDEVESNIRKFDAEDEAVRFKRHLAPGIEGLTIAAFTAFLVIVVAFSGVDTRGHAALTIVLVFSMRYAIVYVRDLGRSITALLELRADKTVLPD